MDTVIVENLTRRFGEFAAVDGVCFAVPEGQLVAVLGPNGAGKTTMLEMLRGSSRPAGARSASLAPTPAGAGVPGGPGLGWCCNPPASIRSSLSAARSSSTRRCSHGRGVDELLELIDLTADAQTRVGALSGGQRRRVDLAIAIIGRPEVLFLDEPTTGLDPEARRRTWAAVENLTKAGTTVLLTTHYIDEADRLADRVIVLAEDGSSPIQRRGSSA